MINYVSPTFIIMRVSHTFTEMITIQYKFSMFNLYYAIIKKQPKLCKPENSLLS